MAYTLRGEPNPYVALFQGTPAWAILKGFPWEQLQFPAHELRQALNEPMTVALKSRAGENGRRVLR